MKPRIEKLLLIKKRRNIDAFLLTSAASIKASSGYWYNFETGPSPFHFLPAALFIAPAGNGILLVADSELDKPTHLLDGVAVASYSSYAYQEPLNFVNDFLFQLSGIIRENYAHTARIGIEKNNLPNGLFTALYEYYPGIELIDIAEDLSRLRGVKDDDEIEAIQRAAHLSDIGQAAVLEYARSGITELELFSRVRLAMETAAGARVPMMTDLISGKSTASGGGNPTNKIINHRDLILCDLTPCLNGYWGDSCNTMVPGDPTAEQKKIFTLVHEALEIGIGAIRPGVPARDVDAKMRKHLEGQGGFGHHGGHGVGTLYHEEPRIVPYNTMELQAGMVIALEPAVYKEDYGIRLEHLVVVTNAGCDILTKFTHCFQPA